MSKAIKIGTITQAQILNMERAIRRESDIVNRVSNFKHKAISLKKTIIEMIIKKLIINQDISIILSTFVKELLTT